VTQKNALSASFKDALNCWDWTSQRWLTHTTVEIFKGKLKKKIRRSELLLSQKLFQTVQCDSQSRVAKNEISVYGVQWNEQVEMAIREWLRIQEPGFYRDRIFALMPRGGKNTVSSAITRALLKRTGARCLQNANFRLRVLAIARFQRPLLRYEAE